MKKWLLCFISMIMILSLGMPMTVKANDYLEININDVSDTVNITTDGNYHIKGNGTETSREIFIAPGVNANIKLENVNIKASCPLKIADNSTGNVSIELIGTNELVGNNGPGICKNSNTTDVGTLTISGSGELKAKNIGTDGAGIGSSNCLDVRNIVINSGTITATAGGYGAGIGGGGGGGSAFNITINNGTVTAYGGTYLGAGIGGGSDYYGDRGDASGIKIYGGTVTAIARGSGAGIGGGNGSGNDISITGGSVTAQGSSSAPSIGGNKLSTGTLIQTIEVYCDEEKNTPATNNFGNSIVYNSNRYTVTGNVVLTKDLTINEGETLEITSDSTLDLGSFNYTNNGTLDNSGTLIVENITYKKAISYLDENGISQNCQNYTVLDNTITVLNDGWYVVDEDVTIENRIQINGNVHLILKDGVTLNTSDGIHVGGNNHFKVYAQSKDSNMGTLIAKNSTSGSNYAALGGNPSENYGNITINGGNIQCYAYGDHYGTFGGASIGGGSSSAGGSITINGGSITALSEKNNYSSAIGAGMYGDCGSITINDGFVTATSKDAYSSAIGGGKGSVTINGGITSATGSGFGTSIAPGIGTTGGSNDLGISILVSDGLIRANGIGKLFDSGIGTFKTTENGKAIIYTSYIHDQSDKDNWNAIIFENDEGVVYGDITLGDDFIIKSNESLMIPDDSTLIISENTAFKNLGNFTNNGALSNNGTLTNNASFTNNGTITNNATANFEEGSTYINGNQSTTVLSGTATLNTDGSVNKTNVSTREVVTDANGKITEEVITNSDGSSVHTLNLSNGDIVVTKTDTEGNVVEKITTFPDGSYVKDGFTPTIIEGSQLTYQDTSLTFRSDDVIGNFRKVTVNGVELVRDRDYIVVSGSIKVTLSKDYLKTLQAGTYTVAIVSTNGAATAILTVPKSESGNATLTGTNKENSSERPIEIHHPTANPVVIAANASTGDNNQILFWSVLLLVSGILTTANFAYKKRKQNQ